MNILIATGVYPPRVGGPAQYAKNLEETWKKAGHTVSIATYEKEHDLPTGIRHLYYMLRIIPQVMDADFVLALDTFSVGLPASIVCRILGVPLIIRTGGDFLWEGYVERTKKKVLFKDFYAQTDLNFKEKVIFYLTKLTLKLATKVVFSTEWQKNIWSVYSIDPQKISIIENFYGPKIPSETKNKDFLGSTRPLVWKNLEMLPEGVVTRSMSHDEMIKTMSECYAVILISLGDISPNMILEAIAHNKPFILTRENGITERVKDCALFVDPLDPTDIAEKMNWLLNDANYAEQKKKVQGFTFTHSWEQIGDEFMKLL